MVEENNANLGEHTQSWREVFLYFLFLGFVNIGGDFRPYTR